MKRILSIAVGSMLGVSAAFAAEDSPYLRVISPDDSTMRMDLAVRTLVPSDASRPIVHLVGAVHIGDPSYYTDLQAYLDVHDVVLYEGVGGARPPVPENEERRAQRATERRLKFLKFVADEAVREGAPTPTTGHDLIESQEGSTRTIVENALTDGWGNAIEMNSDDGSFQAISLGADGKPGGQGENADVLLSDLLATKTDRPLDPAAAGLQRDMAHALGLEFQLDGIDYTQEHWRNSDLSIEQIQAALAGDPIPPRRPAGERTTTTPDKRTKPAKGNAEAASDVEEAADALFGALSGDSFMAKAMGVLMKMVGASKQGRAMVKVMLADTLTNADELLTSQEGALGELMTVLTVDRNKAVIADMQAIIANEPDVRSVAIFYGAGHFMDLEIQFVEQLGYQWESTLWVPAMTIDLEEAGLDARQVEGFRKIMKRAIQQQLKNAG